MPGVSQKTFSTPQKQPAAKTAVCMPSGNGGWMRWPLTACTSGMLGRGSGRPGSASSAVPVTTREWQLAARPHGEPTPDDFRLIETERPDPQDGQVVVRMLAMSVDPYMRGRMRAARSYAAPWEVGETMKGGAVGRVVTSRSGDVPEGALVLTDAGWRVVAVLDAGHVQVLP